jgi:ubiquitin-like protein ATG12
MSADDAGAAPAAPAVPPAAPVAAPSPATPSAAAPAVRIQFRAIGGAPILRRTKFRVGPSESVFTVARFLRAQLGLGPADGLWLYVAGAGFAPAPDDTLGDLCAAFGSAMAGGGGDAAGGDRELVLSYSLAAAYG